MRKRISISVNPELSRIISNLKVYGEKDAEIVKNILIAYLSEKGYLNKKGEKK